MSRKIPETFWFALKPILAKWHREEKLTLDDYRVIIKCMDADVNRYRRMREKCSVGYFRNWDGCF